MAGLVLSTPGQGNELETDHDRQGVIVFGGSGNTELADTWVWDGEDWEQKFPRTSPPARDSSAMAYDKARHEVVLFGGSNGSNLLSDTWVWNGTDWKQKFPATSPPARRFEGMAYDAARREVVLFGGFAADSFGNGDGDTWVWNGRDWTQKLPVNSPSPRAVLGTMAYDSASHKVLLFGGLEAGAHFADSDTWEWDGTNWEQKLPAASPDAMFGGFSAAEDIARHKVVVSGRSFIDGAVVRVTWVWDGNSWTREFPVESPSSDGLMAYDRFHRKVVLYDGSGDTSLGNGRNWRNLFPPVSPPYRSNFAMSSGGRECRDGRERSDDASDSELRP